MEFTPEKIINSIKCRSFLSRIKSFIQEYYKNRNLLHTRNTFTSPKKKHAQLQTNMKRKPTLACKKKYLI